MSHDHAALETLQSGLARLHLSHFEEPLWEYLSLLEKWNQAYNLTAIRDKQSMVLRHLMDSLTILPWISGTHILDVGTGAGLPGIPLAITNPHLQVVLLDSNGKKIRFLREVQRALALSNIQLVQMRVENYHPSVSFDTVVSRAFSSLSQMIQHTQHLLAPKGIWLAMKGKCPHEELASVFHPYRVETYTVEGMLEERCCVIVEPFSTDAL